MCAHVWLEEMSCVKALVFAGSGVPVGSPDGALGLGGYAGSPPVAHNTLVLIVGEAGGD